MSEISENQAHAPANVIYPTNGDVSQLPNAGLALLEAVIKQYDLERDVFMQETIHGHIAVLLRKQGRYIPGSEGSPARLSPDDMAFFCALEGARWFEFATNVITIGLDTDALNKA